MWGLRPQVRSGPIGPRSGFFFQNFFFSKNFFFQKFFFFNFFFHFFFRQLLRLVASRHLEKMMTRNVEIGIGSVNETGGPSVLGSGVEWLCRKVGSYFVGARVPVC